MKRPYLHIDLVVFTENEIASSEGSNESEEWVISTSQPSEDQSDDLVDSGEEGKIAGVLKGGLQNELELFLQTEISCDLWLISALHEILSLTFPHGKEMS